MALKITILLGLNLLFVCQALAGPKSLPITRNEIIGAWDFNGFLFEGNYYPRPNPNLTVTFKFQADGGHSLYYARKGELGFCERRGTYELNGDALTMRSTWLNPKNDESCGKDADMQPGRVTVNRISWQEHDHGHWFEPDLGIEMELNDRPLIYLISRQNPSEKREKSLNKSRGAESPMGH